MHFKYWRFKQIEMNEEKISAFRVFRAVNSNQKHCMKLLVCRNIVFGNLVLPNYQIKLGNCLGTPSR